MQGNDSERVVRFMREFARLKEWTDDQPTRLEEFAAKDGSIGELASKLSLHAFLLKSAEMSGRQLFTKPVNPAFISAWRYYEARYSDAVKRVWAARFHSLLADRGLASGEQSPRVDSPWNDADEAAREASNAVEMALNFAEEQVSQEWRDFPEGFREDLLEGTEAWDELKRSAGFDLRGAVRRRALIPFILIPPHVSNPRGDSDLLYQNLQQAHDAFIFGARNAALALLRSVVERVLVDHYGAKQQHLAPKITEVAHLLPADASEPALRRINARANAILHPDAKDSDLPPRDQVQLEMEFVWMLLSVRALIEQAPPTNKQLR